MKRSIRRYCVKKEICRQKERDGKKMNPVYLFKPFSRIPEEILKY
jgi:hypothetical protein